MLECVARLLEPPAGSHPHPPGVLSRAMYHSIPRRTLLALTFLGLFLAACASENERTMKRATDTARAILARGVVSLPRSTEIWIAAAKLEGTDERKRRVLRKALENIPNSVRLSITWAGRLTERGSGPDW